MKRLSKFFCWVVGLYILLVFVVNFYPSPPLPIQVSFRHGSQSQGMIVTFRNTSEKLLRLLTLIKNPETYEGKEVVIQLQPHEAKDVDWEGFEVEPGDDILITSLGHKKTVYAVPYDSPQAEASAKAKRAAEIEQQLEEQSTAMFTDDRIRSEVCYDKLNDVTKLKSPDFILRKDLSISITIAHPGTKLTRPGNYEFEILWCGPNWRYIHNNSRITFTADGTTITQDNGFDKDADVEVGWVIETIHIDLTPEQLKKIAYAKSLDLKAGGYPESLTSNFQNYCQHLYNVVSTFSP